MNRLAWRVWVSLLSLGLGAGALAATARADVIINVPVIIRDRTPEPDPVIVDFIVPGEEWATVSLNGRLLFQAYNANRRHRIALEPGAYYLEVTGLDRFDVWATGYLDVGAEDRNILVVRASRRGVRVSGDPYAWIPAED